MENWVSSPMLNSSSLLEQISLTDFLFCVISGAVTTPTLTWPVNLHTGLTECPGGLMDHFHQQVGHQWSVLLFYYENCVVKAEEAGDCEMLKHVNVICSSGRFYVSSMFPIITVKCKIRYWNSLTTFVFNLFSRKGIGQNIDLLKNL